MISIFSFVVGFCLGCFLWEKYLQDWWFDNID